MLRAFYNHGVLENHCSLLWISIRDITVAAIPETAEVTFAARNSSSWTVFCLFHQLLIQTWGVCLSLAECRLPN